jgi:hypothetical protein
VSYSTVDKYKSAPNFKKHSSHKNLFISLFPNNELCSPDKPERYIPTIIPYDKQPRQFFFKNKTIGSSNYSDVTVVKKNFKTVNMANYLSRSKELFRPPEFSLSYEPKKEYLMRDLGKVLNFSTMSRRKSLFIVNQTPEVYDANFRAVLPNSKTFSMSKKPELLSDPNCPLPSFMQTVHSRLSMSFSSLKSMKIN